MPIGYAYIRYSTRRQGTDDKDSVTRQKAGIRAIAASHGVEVPEENFFYEDGVSAYTGDNEKKGKLKDLIDQIEALTISEGDYVFVESIDRLSRQRLLQTKDLVYGILKKGVIIVTTIDGYVYRLRENQQDTLHQDIMLSVISTRAHEESLTKSTRRKSAWRKAKTEAETGIVFNKNRLPYGVIFNEETQSLGIDEVARDEIEFILQNLKREGVTATIKKANQFAKINWTQARVKDFFETKYVLGYFMSQKKIEGKIVFDKYVEDYYPKMVEPSLFLEAKEAMKNRKVRKHSGRVTQDNINIFRHSCFCQRCGKSLVFMNNYNRKGRRYFYMTCQQNIETGACKNRFRYDLAVKIFFDTMKEFDRLNNSKTSVSPIDIAQYKELDEVTLKEIEDINKALELINEHSSGAFKLARKFLELSKAKPSADRETKKKLKDLTTRKHQLEVSISNLNKSVEALTSGAIPLVIIARLSKEEQELSSIREEIEKLEVSKNQTKIHRLEFNNLKKTKEFLMTEEGRLNIINFLTSNAIKFSFDFSNDTLAASAYVGSDCIGLLSTKNENRSAPLECYGFENLGSMLTSTSKHQTI